MRLALTRGRAASAVLAASMVAVGLVGLAQSSQAAGSYQVSPKTGPGGAGSTAKVVTVTGSGFKSATGVVQPTAVYYFALGTACATTGGTTIATTAWSVPTSTQLVVTMPASIALGTANAKKDYTICVYNGSTLMGSTKYTVYPVPTITASATAIAPHSGPASGGNTIAITGTGLTSTTVVKIGTVAATGVKVATDGTSLTAKVPAQAASATPKIVSVTTEGGTNAVLAGTDDEYTYKSAISVSPATGTGTLGDVITVTGVGFDSLVWTGANSAAVYLSTAAVDDTALPTDTCTGVQVVSDTQLVCKLTAAVTDAAYTVYLLTDKTDDTTSTVVSSSATYTVADF